MAFLVFGFCGGGLTLGVIGGEKEENFRVWRRRSSVIVWIRVGKCQLCDLLHISGWNYCYGARIGA